MKNKFISLLLMGVISVGMLTACTKGQATQTQKEEVFASKSETSNVSGFNTEKYIIDQSEAVKMMGLESVPVSAVSIDLSSSLLALESGISMVGIPDNHHIPEEYLEKIKHISDENRQVNWDLIKELSPSVIFIDEASKAQFASELDQLNIPVYTPTFTTYDSVLAQLGILASAFGTNNVAESKIENYIGRIEDMLSEVKDKPKKSIALVQLQEDGLMLYTGGTYADDLFKTVNIKNIAEVMNVSGNAENKGVVKIEISDLMKANPDSIAIIVRVPRESSETAYNALMDEFSKDEYKNVNAVKNGKIEKIDHHQFMVRGILGINGMETAFRLAYE